MAQYLPIRAISRSQQVRVDGQKIGTDHTAYVNIGDGRVRRELSSHLALGAIIPVGSLSTSTGDVVVDWGLQTTEGASGADLVLTTEAGELLNRDTSARVDVDSTDVTLAAAHATLVRIDIVQVNTTTGVVTKKDGTAAASPAAPAADTGNIVIARVNVPATDTAITNSQITDARPRG